MAALTLTDLLRLAQSGARGFTTGLLGAPVDIANTMMAVVGGQKPVMGSAWIGDKLQSMGLLAPPADDLPNEAAEFAGGLLNPGGGAAVAGKAALLKDPALAMALVRGFHGSGRDISKFSLDAPKNTGGSFNKYGVSFSADPKVANRYATDFNQSGAVVYPVKADLDKTLNLSAREFHKLQELVGKVDSGKPLSELDDIGLELLLNKAGIRYQQGQHPIQTIRSAGYDSIASDTGRHGVAEQEYLVFDPDKVKFGLLDK